ncbi:hypothetical protein NMG60_11027205 [Bertholletia excelsa]
MDFVRSLLPFDQFDNLIQFSSVTSQERTIRQNDILHIPFPRSGEPLYSPRQKLSVASEDVDDDPSEYKRKKILHKEVERRRRQEMAALYKSLRSLLPPHHLKGKRSICDHTHETVKYIRQLEKRIKELREKRDELKISVNESSINGRSESFTSAVKNSVIRVGISKAGVQVLVCTASISRVLGVLTQEGLTVLSCISTRVNGSLLHTIECQVSEGRSINTAELQSKLRDLLA